VNVAFIPIAILLVLAASMIIVMRLVSKEVSRQRLSQVEDLGSLWKTSFPPKQVLTDKGRRILFWYRVFGFTVIIISGLIGWFFTGFSSSVL